MIRVAFILNVSGNGWLGGVNYYRNLLSAIHELPNRKIEPILVFGTNVDPKLVASLPPFHAVYSKTLDKWTPFWILRKLLQTLLRRDIVLENILIRNKIDVLSHSTGFGRTSKVRSISWIADFQHMHLPQFFQKKEIKTRNKEMLRLVSQCDCTILSSENARKDCMKFLKVDEERTRVLKFAAAQNNHPSTISCDELKNIYKLDAPYFYLPNQFWTHKNHQVVIDALALLKSNGNSLVVVCTGNTDDHRNPDYFSRLMKYAEQKNVTDVFKVLGVLPFNHVQALMRNAIAVINPSLFEGWSTTVEEAKSFGKKLLLSNIEVHKEQDPDRCHYFGVSDSRALANLIAQTAKEFDAVEEALLQSHAMEAHKIRVNKFAEHYEDIVTEVHSAPR